MRPKRGISKTWKMQQSVCICAARVPASGLGYSQASCIHAGSEGQIIIIKCKADGDSRLHPFGRNEQDMIEKHLHQFRKSIQTKSSRRKVKQVLKINPTETNKYLTLSPYQWKIGRQYTAQVRKSDYIALQSDRRRTATIVHISHNPHGFNILSLNGALVFCLLPTSPRHKQREIIKRIK